MSAGPAHPMRCKDGSSGNETSRSKSSTKEVSGQAEGAVESRSIYRARFSVVSHSPSGNSVAQIEGVALALWTYAFPTIEEERKYGPDICSGK